MKKNKIKYILIGLTFIVIGFLVYSSIGKTYADFTQLKNSSYSQMMGYFIKTKNEKIIVVDGGTTEDSENLQRYINDNGGKVDYWFLTHYHDDHTGALSDIIDNTDIKIENIICSFCDRELVEKYENDRLEDYDKITNSLSNERVRDKTITPQEGQVFNIDNKIKVKILSLYKGDIYENLGNNTSMVFKLYINNKSILFLGDTGVEKSEELLKNNLKDLKSNYVQMAHHGQNGATQELYKQISPKYCFWPTPEWLWNNDGGGGYNSGPWKTVETRKWMEDIGVKENYIEKDGNITIKIY